MRGIRKPNLELGQKEEGTVCDVEFTIGRRRIGLRELCSRETLLELSEPQLLVERMLMKQVACSSQVPKADGR